MFFRVVIFVLFLVICFDLSGADVSVHGFVDSYHGTGISRGGDLVSSRSRARVETDIQSDEAGAFVSFNAVQNGIVESENGFNLNEAYLNYYSDYIELSAGKQIIIWGAADGVAVTDIVSPKDYSESLARDFDDMRIGVDSIRLRYLGDQFNIEAVMIPVFTPAVVPYAGADSDEQNPWAYDLEGFVLDDAELPDPSIQNSEYGIRAIMRNSVFDAGLSCLYTWNDMGLLRINEEGNLYQKYYRMLMVGSEFSMPLGEVILRSEFAMYHDQSYAVDDIMASPVKKNSANALAGLDYTPGDGWSLSTQLYNVTIVDYSNNLDSDEYSTYHTLSVSKKFFRETLSVSTMVFYGYVHGDFYNRSYAEYALTDDLFLTGGIDVFGGDGGSFGAYDDNSQVFGKVKYGF